MKKFKNRKIILAGLCALLAFTSAGCSQKTAENAGVFASSDKKENMTAEESVTKELFAMDTYMTITVYGGRADEAANAAEAEITRLDELLSTGNENSEIYRLNHSPEETFLLSEDSSLLIEEALLLYEQTNGAFNIAVYPLMETWGFTTQEFRVPGEAEIQRLLTYTDLSQIYYNSSTKEIRLPKGMQIDLGGIAKGYTSSRVMEIMESYGVTSAMVNLGGNVQVLGSKTDNSSWRVAVQDPSDPEGMLGVLSVTDKAVITSGGYERYFEEDGVTYHHILDPKTGYPAESGIVSVTIVTGNGTLADGLSTSLFIMGKDLAEEYWKNHSDDFDYILVTEDETIYVTAGIADLFESEGRVVIVDR